MSNVGKTYWSKKLESLGFYRLGCDDLIENKLEKELKKYGYSGINDVARWLGQPYEKQYGENSLKYLNFETQAVEEIIQRINCRLLNGKKVVIDITGSVIYLGEKIVFKLKKSTKIVYLDTPMSVQKRMFEAYIQNPKPVIWGNHFIKEKGQTDFEALTACYPKLLAYRTSKYKEYADITIDYSFQRADNINTKKFINFIQYQLR